MIATTTKRLVTVDDLLELPSDYRCELIEGVLVEVSPAGPVQGKIAGLLTRALITHDVDGAIGDVWSADTGYVVQRGPDTVLAPDLALVRRADADAVTLSDRGFGDIVPLIAIEISSPDDTEREITRKLGLYLSAGVPEVWWVRPRRATVTRTTPDGERVVFGRYDTLTSTVLPGFALALVRLFGE